MTRIRSFISGVVLLTTLLAYPQRVFDYNHEGLNLVYRVTDEDMRTCKVMYVPAALPLYSENEEFIAHSYAIPAVALDYDKVEYTVTEIEEEAFLDYDQSRILSIPSSVTAIGARAFLDSRIESVIIDAEVEALPPQMFSGCDALRLITINSSEPPKICEDTFPDAVLANAELKLRSGTQKLYGENALWSRFECMKSSSEAPSGEPKASLRFTPAGLPLSTSSQSIGISTSTQSTTLKDAIK